jgi:molecular chaperone GrpE
LKDDDRATMTNDDKKLDDAGGEPKPKPEAAERVKDGATETAAENASGWAAGAEAAAAAAAEAQQQAGPTVEDLKDQLLRALAETENVRRRAQRDVGDARQYAISAFARDMLSVADNFARALAAVPEDELARNPAVASLVEGVRMTERELLNALEKHGIRTVEPRGEKFDPNLHQAMFEVERPDVPAGTVVEVVQKGSMIGERVLRPAMVVVSKGGPKAPKPEPTDTPAAAG